MSTRELTDVEREAMLDRIHETIDQELTVTLIIDDPGYIVDLFGRTMICTHASGEIRPDGKWDCVLKLAPE